jgi:hypothetical protein
MRAMQSVFDVDEIDGVRKRTDDLATELVADGYVTTSGRRHWGHVLSRAFAWRDFTACWDDLPADRYWPQSHIHRFRRYGRAHVELTLDGVRVRPLRPKPFQQSKEDIPLYGGMAREFAPIERDVLELPLLQEIIRADYDVVSVTGGRREYCVGIHFIRTVTAPNRWVPVTPEGRHRDGHHFVGMHLISRAVSAGGDSIIYDAASDKVLSVTTLTDPLDSILVDDTRVEHEVTPIRASCGAQARDMLLLDFDAYEGD